MGYLRERLSLEQVSILETYTQYDLKILEDGPFHISKFKFCELSIDGQRKKILNSLFFYKYMLIKQWGSNILGVIYETD